MGPSRSRYLLSACSLAILSWSICGCGGTDETEAPPDILVICIDALRADHLGCYGYIRDTSPHIDALAKRSSIFETTWSASSWTKSAVPSLFTGLLPSEHRVFEGSHRDSQNRITSDVLDAQHVTLAEALKERGYRTAAFIKNAQLRAFLGFDQGFDLYLEDAGDADEIVTSFLQWYEDRQGTPSFAYLHILDPHWPYRPRPPFDTRFGSTTSDMDFATKKYRALRDGINSGETVPAVNDLTRMVELYDGLICQVDHALSRVFEAFDRLEDPPVVIITADHGEEFFENGKIGHGHSLSERLLRIPLIFSVPGHSPGRHRLPCSLIDLFPTVCALANADAPNYISGRDLFAPEEPRGPRVVVAERRFSNRHLIAWREGDLKLIRAYRAPREKIDEGGNRLDEGLRVEVRLDDELVHDVSRWRADKLEIKKDQSEDGLEVQGLLEELDAGNGLVRVLGIEGFLRPDVAVSSPDGSTIGLRDVERGLPVEIDGRFDEKGVYRVKKLEIIDPERFSPEIEGFIEKAQKSGRTWIIALGGGRTVRVDRDSRFKDERETAVSEEDPRPREDALRPALLASSKGLDLDEQLYDLVRDPQETSDLSETRSADRARLGKRLEQWLARADRWVEWTMSERVELDEKTVEDLKAIGYLR